MSIKKSHLLKLIENARDALVLSQPDKMPKDSVYRSIVKDLNHAIGVLKAQVLEESWGEQNQGKE